MKTLIEGNGPVVIGGIGGSGTRVVAEILARFGYFIGHDLNIASDNLTYTLLFKRPEWFRKNFDEAGKFKTGLSILEKSMIKGGHLTFRERLFLWKALRDMSKKGHNKEGEGKGDWPYQRLPFIRSPQLPGDLDFVGWGWKEPNSHLLLPVMHDYFPHFRYIHTVRHGLDMAYSNNQQQLFNWAPLFGLEIPGPQSEIPKASLRYWVEANRKVLSYGELLGEKKFLLVNFDALCLDPLPGVKKIAGFLNIGIPDRLISEAVNLPVMPRSAGRYKEFGIKGFDKEDLSFLEEMGFSYAD